MWDSCDCSYKCDIMCWLLVLSTKSINAVAKFLEVFFTDEQKDRQTDRQTDKHTDSLCPCCAYTQALVLLNLVPRPPEGLRVWEWDCGTAVCVCVCVCAVFSVLKLFTVELAIFTAGSKPTSKAKLFTHISRWWGLIAWEQHFRHWGGSLNTNVEEIFGRAACEAIEPYVLITHTHTHTLAFVCWVFLLNTCELNATMQITFSSVHLL